VRFGHSVGEYRKCATVLQPVCSLLCRKDDRDRAVRQWTAPSEPLSQSRVPAQPRPHTDKHGHWPGICKLAVEQRRLETPHVGQTAQCASRGRALFFRLKAPAAGICLELDSPPDLSGVSLAAIGQFRLARGRACAAGAPGRGQAGPVSSPVPAQGPPGPA
jgi:hypothetical protein